jgi:Ubiquitin carboxyl-terminal hydrolase
MYHSTGGDILGRMFRPWLASSTYCRGRCQKKRKQKQDGGSNVLNEQNWIHIIPFQNEMIRDPKQPDFQHCFEASLKQIQEDYPCPHCKRKVDRTVNDRFVELPPILLTQLNRSNNDSSKIQNPCEIPRELTVPLDDSVRRKSKYKNPKYRLAAVVAHTGSSSKSGHYISYVRNPAKSDRWIELNDEKVRDISFEEISHHKWDKKMLPFLMAWELIEDGAETDNGDWKENALDGRKNPSDDREAALDSREKELTAQEKSLDDREAALDTREKELTEQMPDVTEIELRKRELQLRRNEESYLKKIEPIVQKSVANQRERADLDDREKTLNDRELDLKQRAQRLQVRKEGDGLSNNSTGNKASGAPAKQGEPTAKGLLDQEVDKEIDTATFCATFRNTDNHDETARAIFKLNNFNSNAATKIESTVQLSDLEGNLRVIKKGTTVNDEFTITFNAKGEKKRKRGNDDDEHGPPSPPAKKPKGQSRASKKPQSTLKLEFQARNKPSIPSNIKFEQNSAEMTSIPPKKSPPPRRSTRINKGQRSKRA